MKKIQLLIFMLCMASVAMAQEHGKIKKITFQNKYQKQESYHDKIHGGALMQELIIWPTSEKETTERRKTCRNFDEKGSLLTENFKIFEKKDKKEVLILNEDTEFVFGSNFYTKTLTSKNFVLNKTTKTKTEQISTINRHVQQFFYFDFAKNTYLPDYHYIWNNSLSGCPESYDYSTFDENGNLNHQEITYFVTDEKCNLLREYHTNKSFIDNKIDTFKIVKSKTSENYSKKEEKHLYKYPPKKEEIRIDSTFNLNSNADLFFISEVWRSNNTYEKRELSHNNFYTKKNEKFTLKDSLGTHQYIIFNSYNFRDDNLFTTLIRYKNGVLDSTTMEVKELHQYTYNQLGLIEKKESLVSEYLEGVTLHEYNCKNWRTKETFISTEKDTSTYTYEYYDDPCIEEKTLANDFFLYPNPVFGNELILQTNENQKLTKYEIFNAAGQLIYTEKENTKMCFLDKNLNINSLEKGYYFLRAFFDNGETKTKSFVKM